MSKEQKRALARLIYTNASIEDKCDMLFNMLETLANEIGTTVIIGSEDHCEVCKRSHHIMIRRGQLLRQLYSTLKIHSEIYQEGGQN